MFFMIGLVEDFIDPSLYSLKAPYEIEAKGIVIHNTWNDATAKAERNYMVGNKKPTGFHIVVDDKEALQLIPFERIAYHCGNNYGNKNYIGMEICYSRSGGEKFEKAEDNAIDITADILIEKGWTTDDIKFHKDFANKNCPNLTVPDKFVREVEEEINSRGYRISNKPTATLRQLNEWALSKNASKLYIDLLPIMYEKAVEYGVDPMVLTVQCALETGYLKKGNSQSGGHNPAGIKSAKNPRVYAKYDSWDEGFEAQAKLLAKYAGTYGNESSWLFGKCKTVEGLTKLWAENPNYDKMLLKMINEVKSFKNDSDVANDNITYIEKEEEIKKPMSLLEKLKSHFVKKTSTGKDKINDILNK